VPKPSSLDGGRSISGPQAFLGWSKEVSGYLVGPKKDPDPADRPFYEKAASEYTKTLAFFYVSWMNNTPLNECINWSSSSWMNTCPFPVEENKEIKITIESTTKRIPVMTGKPYVVGYSGLTVSGHRPEFDGFYEPPYQR
jgi:hypothetical protein